MVLIVFLKNAIKKLMFIFVEIYTELDRSWVYNDYF